MCAEGDCLQDFTCCRVWKERKNYTGIQKMVSYFRQQTYFGELVPTFVFSERSWSAIQVSPQEFPAG